MKFVASLANAATRPVRRAAISLPLGAAALALLPFLAGPACAEQLPLARLFPAPDLAGPTLRGAQISPDGRLIAYLKARDDDKDRFDLWAFDVVKRQHRLLVDSRTLAGADKALSADEASRRERQRTAALS